MEVRQYLAVLWRRWPVIAIVVALAVALGVYTYWKAPKSYTAAVRLLVRQEPSPPSTAYFTYDRYYSRLGEEFLSDDYTLVVTTRAFADRVATLLSANPQHYALPAGTSVTTDQVLGTLSGDRKQRVLTVAAQTGDPALAQAIANGAADALTQESQPGGTAPALNGLQIADGVQFGLLDPSTGAAGGRGRALVNAAIAVALGIVAALALAFLLDYFDTRVRDEAEMERLLGVPVLGAIPRK